MFNFRAVVTLSIVVAGFSAVVPFGFQDDPSLEYSSFIASLCAAAIWLLLLAVALIKFKLRGLWLLLVAPVAFLWPLYVGGLLFACAHSRFACP
jgi:hypothetical protein